MNQLILEVQSLKRPYFLNLLLLLKVLHFKPRGRDTFEIVCERD